MEKPKLQLALDCSSLEEAFSVMAGGLADKVDIIEVGTYLLVLEGTRAVGMLRAAFPDKWMVADANSVDPAFAELVMEQNAQMVTLNSMMPDDMMQEALREARRHGQIGQICLYGDSWTLEDARRWQTMGAEYIVCTNFHGEWLPEDIEKVKALCAMGYQVSVADGVNYDNLALFAGIPLYAVVFGRAIRKASCPVEAAETIQNRINELWRC